MGHADRFPPPGLNAGVRSVRRPPLERTAATASRRKQTFTYLVGLPLGANPTWHCRANAGRRFPPLRLIRPLPAERARTAPCRANISGHRSSLIIGSASADYL